MKRCLRLASLSLFLIYTIGANATIKTGPYVQTEVGYGWYPSLNGSQLIPDGQPPFIAQRHNTSRSGMNARGSLGYQITQYLAVEAGFQQLAHFGLALSAVVGPSEFQARVAIKFNSVDLVLKGMFPVCKNLYIVGKAGAAFIYDSTSTFGAAVSTAGSNAIFSEFDHDRRYVPTVAAGVAYLATQSLGLEIMYSHLFKKGTIPGDNEYFPGYSAMMFGIFYVI